MTDDVTGCLACDLTHGRRHLPGAVIAETRRWRVEHCVGPLGVGTLLVKTLRHVVSVADLSSDEAEELGPLLTRTADVVRRLVAPEQVYVCLWSHAERAPGHVHFVVQPAAADVIDQHHGAYGPALQTEMFRRGVVPAADDTAAFADRARAAWPD